MIVAGSRVVFQNLFPIRQDTTTDKPSCSLNHMMINPEVGSTRNGTTPWFGTIKGRHQASIDGIAPRFRLIVTSLSYLTARRQTGNILS